MTAWAVALGTALAAPAAVLAADGNGPDAARFLQVAGGEDWTSDEVRRISWKNPDHSVGIKAALYRVCPVEAQRQCLDEKRVEADVRRVEVRLDEPGDYTFTVRLKDTKGRLGERSSTVHLRFDDEPPTSKGFEHAPSGDPRELGISVEDEHSGPADVDVELRRQGGNWQELKTDADGEGEVTVRIPDLDLPPGEYEVRALARDVAGNLAVVDQDTDGDSMRLELPLRRPTAITASAQMVRTVRRCRRIAVRSGGRATSRQRCGNVSIRDSVAFPAPAPVRIAHGQRLLITGALDGAPGRGAELEVTERPRSAGFVPATRTLTLDAGGRFALTLEPGPSRTVELNYAGDERTLPSSTQAELLVPAASTLAASRRLVSNGQSVTFTGRLLGGPLPQIGRTVDLQAHYRGAWRTFATPRTDAAGAWRYVYRFGATRGRVTYAFRVVIQREAGYPYETGITPVVRVTVRGR
jgi:hypothetical protein